MTEVLVEIDDPVCTITLNRPETLNALTYPMLASFREAVDAAARDARVVGIVITGAGRGFCSGLDASVLQATTTAGSSTRPKTDDVPGLFTCSHLQKDEASPSFGQTNWRHQPCGEADRGVPTVEEARQREHRSRRQACWRRAAQLRPPQMTTSRKIDAAEAHRIGLVQQVVEPDDLLAACRRYVVDLAENVSPVSLADTKRLVYEGFGVQYPDALQVIDEVQYAALDRVDSKEGAAALIEKRPASFPRLGA